MLRAMSHSPGKLQRVGLILSTLVFAAPGLLYSQNCKDRPITQSAGTEELPAPILEAPIALRQEIGNAHEKITTSSPQAQVYYDQGLSYLYSYDWIHAARSFHEALRLDPILPMAYVGLSYLYSGLAENSRAREMASKANQLAERGSAAERVRISLRNRQLDAMDAENDGHGSSEYIKALDKALASDSNNVNLLLLRGVAAEGYGGAIGQRGREESIHYYEKVLQLEPENVAAHHFLVHANEMVNNLSEAVRHGEIYRRLAPAVAHAHHMSGHDLRRTDGVGEAIAQFEIANDLEETGYKAEPNTLLYDWNYRHNLNLLGAAYAQAGRLSAARKTLTRLADLRSFSPADDFYKSQLATFLLREGLYTEAAKAASVLEKSQFGVGRMLGYATAGSAAAQSGNLQRAHRKLLLAEKENDVLGPAWTSQLGAALEILRAQVELGQGDRDRAVSRLRQHVLSLRSLSGSDAWSDTMFQLRFMASIAGDAGEWELARFIAHQLLEHAPHYAGAHKVLARVTGHDGDVSAAQRELELARRWSLQ